MNFNVFRINIICENFVSDTAIEMVVRGKEIYSVLL